MHLVRIMSEELDKIVATTSEAEAIEKTGKTDEADTKDDAVDASTEISQPSEMSAVPPLVVVDEPEPDDDRTPIVTEK